MTSPRRRSQKSMSMSGSDTRSGLRKRSKIQVEVQRIDVGDPQAVGDEAAGRRPAARARPGMPLLARVADEVPDDQEVPGYFIRLIIAISYVEPLPRTRRSDAAARPRAASAASRGSRASNPCAHDRARSTSSSVNPGGTSKFGQVRLALRQRRRCSARRCARVLAHRLRDSRRRPARISSAVFRKNWSPWYRSRFSSLTLLPVPMHSRTSCGCWSVCRR